ncbi:MAG: glycerol-3-phosphate acyltransferase, partial [Elusimicrobiota bacterium]|nr:glycerol-3-phosphate acyltransferase [Elusimicrobiota bacterium]
MTPPRAGLAAACAAAAFAALTRSFGLWLGDFSLGAATALACAAAGLGAAFALPAPSAAAAPWWRLAAGVG